MIRVELEDRFSYRLSIIGVARQLERARLKDLPVRRAVWRKEGRIDVISHFVVPREDIGEIARRWPEDERQVSRDVAKDLAILEKYSVSPMDLPRHPRPDYEFGIEKQGGQLSKDQLQYVCMDKQYRRSANAFLGGEGKAMSGLERARFLGFTQLLIVTTGNMFDDWTEEIQKIWPKIKILHYRGTIEQRKKLIQRELHDARIVLATYDLSPELPMDGFDSFIFDEADLLQNPETQRFKNFKVIIDATWAKPGIPVQSLTGTVKGNAIESMWFAYHLMHPYMAGTYQSFKYRHTEVINFKTQMVKRVMDDGTVVYKTVHKADKVILANVDELRRKARSIIQSTEARDFEENSAVIECVLGDEQRAAYEAIRDGTLLQVQEKEIDMNGIKNKFSKMRECLEGLHIVNIECSAKFDWIRGFIERCKRRNRKVIFFSPFRAGLDKLAAEFADCSVSYNGDMSQVEKRLAAAAFAGLKPGHEKWFKQWSARKKFPFQPGEAQFLWMTLHDQISRGLNLHWQCHTAVFITISDKVKANRQAYWRINRKGQRYDTRTYYLKTDTRFEQVLLEKYVRQREEDMLVMNRNSQEEIADILRTLRREKLEI